MPTDIDTHMHQSYNVSAPNEHAGSAGALLGPTLTALRALLDGPAAARNRDVLLELLLTLPTRSAPWGALHLTRVLADGAQ